MGASAVHLHKLDLVQKMVERLCGTTFCHWLLVVRLGPLACCVNCWIHSVGDFFRISAQSLFLLRMPTPSTML